ncbi:amino acid adenylation domain-containing protein [Kitasatospora sp. NPDC002227]|uniref:non-ribosomal peptide synthetase n=1 Tax=Kitasatospora sp. NPDC002227 TaxID=3154773 RepID=UPI00332E9FFD
MIDTVRQFVELPAAPAQQALWVIDRFGGQAASYAVPCALRVDGAFDPAAARTAFEHLVLRHEPLRTCFRWDDGQLTQLVAEPAEDEPVPLDWAQLTVPAERWEEVARAEAAAPFDLAAGPLLRIRVLRAGEREHLLVLSAHHIVVDGVSLAVLLREFAVCYHAALAGRQPELPEPELQYGDFAQWQLDRLTEEAIAADVAYWRERLADAPVLDLVTDRPRQAQQSHRGEVHRFELPDGLIEALREYARREQVTLFATLLAVFESLMCRYSRAEEVCVGVTVGGRNTPQLQETVGMFVNLLVFRGRTGDDPSLRELAGRAQAEFLDSVEHAELPFSWLVERIGTPRDLSRNPLFQTTFALDRAVAAGVRLEGAELRQIDLYLGIAKFDLQMTVHDDGERLWGTLEYDTDLFDAAVIARMGTHFTALAAAAVADPGTPLSELDLVPAAERQELLGPWNSPGGALLTHEAIGPRFEHWAATTPEAPAVLSPDGTALSYRELNERANRLAHRLRSLGTGPEQAVGILLPPTAEMVVAVLAVLKAGGVYVPLVASHPEDRLRQIVGAAGAPVVLTLGRYAERFGYQGAPHAVLLDRAEPGAWPAEDPAPTALADNLAYIVYTSGSTGAPKGIGISHRSVLHRVHEKSYPGLGPGDVRLLLAPLSFDGSVWELWSTLLNGGALALPDPALPFPANLRDALERHRIDHLFLMSAQLQMALDAFPDLLGRVHELTTGGDVLSPVHARRAAENLPAGGVVVNNYGPTECTVFATAASFTEIDDTRSTVPIGLPVPDTTAHLMDENFRLVPVGVPGEIWLGGPGVARGYVGRPGLTADRFVPDPFGPPGARLYRTGDLARRLPDGRLDFIGRIDGQVKVRGYRIELGEVTTVLQRHPAVRAAEVVVRDDLPGGRDLVAYLVPEREPVPDPELRELLAGALPGYMIPAALVWLDELPLNANGKVDRRALPAPQFGRGEAGAERPRTESEARLLAAWEELLGVDGIGRDDKFFDVGGNSLLLVALHGLVRELFPAAALSLVELFEYTTCAELAAVLDRRGAAAPAPGTAGAEFDL